MKILISTSSFGKYDSSPLQKLKDSGYEIILNPYARKLQPGEIIPLLDGVIGLIAGTEPLTANVLESARNLKVISRCGVGTDNVDIEAAKKLGIKVLNTPDAPTHAVAELTIGLILNLLRGISMEDRLIRAGEWKKHMGELLSGKTIGILGLGRIGKRIVELTSSFGLKYIAWDISPDLQFADKYKVTFMNLDEVLKKADIISIHLPYTPELKNFISEKEISLMKKNAFLINTARGRLIDEAALYKALEKKIIAGAAIDTFTQEPYNGPLKNLENIVLTCHIGSYAKEARIKMEIDAVRNLIEVLKEVTI